MSLRMQLTKDLHIRLSDFGSSLLIHPSQPPTDGLGLGTLPFSPPELIDPNQCFSFPVDIFALGATLLQCLTGREPFRGLRTVEMMYHVRKGGLWDWEERERLIRIGASTDDASVAGSPYPSAWRAQQSDGVRRAGSLRVQMGDSRPRLARMSSAESLLALDDVVDGPHSAQSPSGIRLWAKWAKRQQTSSGHDAMLLLLNEGGDATSTNLPPDSKRWSAPTSRQSSLPSPLSPGRDADTIRVVSGAPYRDGSPGMSFLDGKSRVTEDIREVLKAMLDPVPGERPTAKEVRQIWDDMHVGEEDREDEP